VKEKSYRMNYVSHMIMHGGSHVTVNAVYDKPVEKVYIRT